jgi:hypothetical protein
MKMSTLYTRAVQAEARYHAAIVAEYGAANAAEARYRLHHRSPAVRQARFEMREANTAWLAALRGEVRHA